MKVIINVRHGSKVVSSTKINTESQAAIFHTPPKMPLQVEFLDQISGLTAEIKETHRNGFDLEITFAGSDQADVIFKDYYTLSELEVPELVGHSEDGRFYSYKFRLKNSGKGNVGSEGAIASEVTVATATEVAKSVFSPLVVAGAGLATAAVAAVGVSHVRKQSSNNTGNSNSNDNSNNQDTGNNSSNNNSNNQDTGSNSGNDNSNNQDTSNNSSNDNSNNQDTGNSSSNDNGKNQDTGSNSGNDNSNNQDTGSNSGNDNSNNQDTGNNSGNDNSNNQDTGNNSGNDNSNNQDTGSNSSNDNGKNQDTGNSGNNDSRQAGDNRNSFTKLVLRLQEDTGTSPSDNYTKNPNIILQGVPKGEHYEYSIDGGYSWTSVENSTDSEIILRLPDNGKSNGQRHIVKARIANKAGIYDADPIVVTYDHVIHSRIGFGSSDGVFIGIGEVGSQNRLLDEFGAFLGEHAIIRGEKIFEESIRIVAENSPKYGSSENSWDIRYMLETKDLAGNEAIQRFTQYTAFTLNNESRHNDITTLMGKESLHKSDSLYIDEHFYRYRENSPNYSELKDTGTNTGLQFQDSDDVLIYYRNFIENSRIDMGAGHDFIYAHGALADEEQPVSLFMGEGEDVLLFNAPLYFSSTYMHSGLSIDLGEGDDKFMLLGGSSIDVAKVNASGSGKLVGGEGIDTLVLMFIPSNDLASIGQWEGISGFEKIEIRGAFHVNDLSIDVLRKNHNSLVISDDGKQHSGVFIIEGSSTDRVSFSKSSIAEAKGESVEYAGTRYDTYHYNSGNEHYEVWVQQGIVVI